MKIVEKILRAPLPDQLKALLEKFDTEFDASHLRALRNLADEPSFTRYERFMLRRAYKEAQVKLERGSALSTAMSVVLNLKEENELYFDPSAYTVKSAIGGTPIKGLHELQKAQENSRASRYAQGLRMHP